MSLKNAQWNQPVKGIIHRQLTAFLVPLKSQFLFLDLNPQLSGDMISSLEHGQWLLQ